MDFFTNFWQISSFIVSGFCCWKAFPCAKGVSAEGLLWFPVLGKLQRKGFLAVDAICIVTSADKLFWIRQVMAAAVGSRVLSDELHFDTLSVFFMIPLSVSSICLYCDLSFTSLHFLPIFSWRVPFVSLPFTCPQWGRLCVTAIPDAMMSPHTLHFLWILCDPHWQSKPQWDWTRL